MKFRIQTDDEKFRVQASAWWTLGIWIIGALAWRRGGEAKYAEFDTRTDAQTWIDEEGQKPPKWRTL